MSVSLEPLASCSHTPSVSAQRPAPRYFRICLLLLGLGLTWVGTIAPASSREPCNRQRTIERPHGRGNPAVRYMCRHDLENNDDQMNEFYSYRTSNLDGKRWQHQNQFRKRNLIVKYYYGEMDNNGGWQWQEVHRFDTGDYNQEGIIKTRQFAMRSPNGAWQQEYQWRTSPNGPQNSCYAQSALDPSGNQRQPVYQCTINEKPASGNASPIPLRNPSFRRHKDW